MRVLLMGPAGSGKSTQGQRLAEKYGLKWVSTGEILRRSTEPWIVEQMKTAKLFPDELIFKLLKEELARVSDANGAVIDGAVRTPAQARKAKEVGIDFVILMKVPEEELLSRVLARGREQDTEEVARQRFADYFAMEAEILGILREEGLPIIEVNGSGTPEEVQGRLDEVMEKWTEGASENG